MYYVYVTRQRADGWGPERHLVGQYATLVEAEQIVQDYHNSGETAVVCDDAPRCHCCNELAGYCQNGNL